MIVVTYSVQADTAEEFDAFKTLRDQALDDREVKSISTDEETNTIVFCKVYEVVNGVLSFEGFV